MLRSDRNKLKVHNQIDSRLNLGSACHQSFQNGIIENIFIQIQGVLNQLLTRISGQARDNCTHNEQLYISYLSLNVINIIKLRMMGYVGHVACTGEREKYTKT
jgi:hypothetical protein